MTALTILGVLIVVVIIFINPKLGTYLIWPILFMYPHRWFFNNQFLPLNMGVDDLFCIALFFAVLIRRNLLGGLQIRFGYAFWVISSFIIIVIISNLSGYRDIISPYVRIDCFKDILKLGIYWGLFYAVLHCVDDIRDLKIQLTMFSMAIVGGALIVILQYFFPYKMEIFTSPKIQAALSDELTRTAGAFLNGNSAACVLSGSLMLIIAAIRLQKNTISKIFVYSFIFVLLLAILLTKSRSGLLSVGGTIMLMGVFGRSKKIAWLVIIAGVVIAVTFTGFREGFLRRIQRTSDIRQDSSVLGRMQTWKEYFHNSPTKAYLLGQGVSRARELHTTESHSTYVSLITVYGIGGVTWAMVALILFFKRTLALRKFPNPLISVVSGACIWALVSWGIYSVAADAINSPYTRYLLFYLIVLADRVWVIAGQEKAEAEAAAWELEYDDEQVEHSDIQPVNMEIY